MNVPRWQNGQYRKTPIVFAQKYTGYKQDNVNKYLHVQQII